MTSVAPDNSRNPERHSTSDQRLCLLPAAVIGDTLVHQDPYAGAAIHRSASRRCVTRDRLRRSVAGRIENPAHRYVFLFREVTNDSNRALGAQLQVEWLRAGRVGVSPDLDDVALPPRGPIHHVVEHTPGA